MNDIKNYIIDKLTEFNDKYNVKHKLDSCWGNDKDMKRQWKRDCENVRLQWQDVNSVSDVKMYIERYASIVERYQNIRGVYLDSYYMDLALYRVISALQKMAQCYDYEALGFNGCNKEEIDALFDRLYQVFSDMEDVNIRRAMQD